MKKQIISLITVGTLLGTTTIIAERDESVFYHDSTTTRAEYMSRVAKSMADNELRGLNTVYSNAIVDVDTDSPYINDILRLYREGIVCGNDEERRCYPNAIITDEEATIIRERLEDPTKRVVFYLCSNNTITEEEFLSEHLTLPENIQNSINESIQNGDVDSAKKVFADYVRSTLKPEVLFSSGSIEEYPDESVIAWGDAVCNHTLTSVGQAFTFDDGINWHANPTANNYREWTWQVNRCDAFLELALAFRATGDMKYVDTFREIMGLWIKQQTPPPAGTSPYDTDGWRTLDSAIRMFDTWPAAIHAFLPYLDDNEITAIFKSIWDHGTRIYRDRTKANNWSNSEMSALLHIGVLYPFIKESTQWYDLGENVLAELLADQVYPDGFQAEITTRYQYAVLDTYYSLASFCRAYGVDFMSDQKDIIKKMTAIFVRLMRPNGSVPDINDGMQVETNEVLDAYRKAYGGSDNYNELYDELCDGTQNKSFVFPYAGIGVLRTGIDKADTMVAFEGGPFGIAHQHEDKLSFVMYADGKQVLTEGNTYAYDTSDMRSYILTARAHNTIAVDGKYQNRRAEYATAHEAEPDYINTPANIQSNLTDDVDYVGATYDEGFGDDCERLAEHNRSLYLIKNEEGLSPFVICVDRVEADNEHNYDILWQLDAEELNIDGTSISADTLNIIPSRAINSVKTVFGQQEPTFQGWTADDAKQGSERKIYTAFCSFSGTNKRVVSVFYPDGGKECPISTVEASDDINDSIITIKLTNGKTFTFNEDEHK